MDVDLSFYVQLADWQGVTPDICRIYDFLYEQDGTPLVNEVGTIKILSLPYSYGDAYYSNEDIGIAYSDESGKIQWDVVYGAKVNIEIKTIGFDQNITVPTTPNKKLSEITTL